MQEYVTKQELRTLGADPRTVRKHLEPDAVLINGTREVELWKRDRIKALAKSLKEAAEKCARQSQQRNEIEMTQESEAYTIEQFDAVTGNTTRRTITPLPQPQRLVKPEIPSLDELRKKLTELTEGITDATKDFDAVNADLDSFFAPHKKLEKRISELRAALSEAEQELAELRSHGTPSEGYRRFVIEAETKVSGTARQLIERYSIDKAREKFETEFYRLSPTTQKDLQISIRMKLDRFASQFYARLGQRNPNATVDQVKARASELLRDLKTILAENFK